MSVELKQVYKTPSGKFLQVIQVNECGTHILIEIEDNVNRKPLPERRNRAGHVTRRVKLLYSEETISTFKKMKSL